MFVVEAQRRPECTWRRSEDLVGEVSGRSKEREGVDGEGCSRGCHSTLLS